MGRGATPPSDPHPDDYGGLRLRAQYIPRYPTPYPICDSNPDWIGIGAGLDYSVFADLRLVDITPYCCGNCDYTGHTFERDIGAT